MVDVAPQRDRGRPSAGRESQSFFGYVTINIFEDPFGHHYDYHYRGASYNKDNKDMMACLEISKAWS